LSSSLLAFALFTLRRLIVEAMPEFTIGLQPSEVKFSADVCANELRRLIKLSLGD
jgi:hypothetical protein